MATTPPSPCRESRPRLRRGALLTATLLLPGTLTLPASAHARWLQVQGSPWWENYERRDVYRCPDRRTVVLERNDAQASLLSGRFRSTFFREASEADGIRYRDGRLQLILRGDELTLEELPQRLTCIRTEEV